MDDIYCIILLFDLLLLKILYMFFMRLIFKHSNWSKIVVLGSFNLFLFYFIFVNWSLINSFSIELVGLNISMLDYFHFILSSFFSKSIFLKIVFLILLLDLFSTVTLEVISSFLDYIHSNGYWAYCTYWVLCIYYSFYISIFFYICLL